jgi:hypothetical protein
MPTFCQFGKDYRDARDHYVYIYAPRLQGQPVRLNVHKPGQIDLLRVPQDCLGDRSAYEFFAGLDGSGHPTWTEDLAARRPVFEDDRGVGWCLSVSHSVGLQRYFLCTEHDETDRGNLGLFDALEPWGPWTTVGYYNNWGNFDHTFFWNFSNKWLSTDGQRFTMIFIGTGHNDAWNTVQGTFSVGK